MASIGILIGVGFTLAGGYGVAHGDGGGWPMLVIGVVVVGFILGKRLFPKRTTDGEGGE